MPRETTVGRSSNPHAGRATHSRPRSRWLIPGLIAIVIAIVGFGFVAPLLRGGSSAALSTLQTADFHSLAFSPTDPNVVFFGHHNGVMRSDDGGKTWQPLVERRNFDAMGMAVNRANAQEVYLAGHDIFELSTDGGKTWQPVQTDLPGSDIHGFAMSPENPKHLYAFVVGSGLFTSPDGGHTWSMLTDQMPMDVMGLSAAGGNPETLYAASMQSGLLKSVDGGRSWTTIKGLPAQMVLSIASDPSSRNTVYAGVDGGLYKSTDAGATWSRLSFPGDNVVTLAVNPSHPQTLLAISVQGNQGLVYRSEDGGVTWTGHA